MAEVQHSVTEFVAIYYAKRKREVLHKLGLGPSSPGLMPFNSLGTNGFDPNSGHILTTKTKSLVNLPSKSTEGVGLGHLKATKISGQVSRFNLHEVSALYDGRSLTPGRKACLNTNKRPLQERNAIMPSRVKSTPRKSAVQMKMTTDLKVQMDVPSTAEMLLKEHFEKRKENQRNQIEAYYKELHSAVAKSQVITSKQIKQAAKLLVDVKPQTIQEITGSVFPVAVEFLVVISKLQPNSQLTLPQLAHLNQLLNVSLPEVTEETQEFPEDEQELSEVKAALHRTMSNLSIKYITVKPTPGTQGIAAPLERRRVRSLSPADSLRRS